MATDNFSHISSIQPDFSSLTENNGDSLCLSSTSMGYSPPPSLTVHPTAPPSGIFSPLPKPITQTQPSHQNTSTNSDDIPPETADVFDYRIWAIVNLVFGAIIIGIPGFILSTITRRYKREGNLARAKRCSSITVGINIFVSFLYMCGLVGLLTYLHDP